MLNEMDLWNWLGVILLPIALFMVRFWWNVESKQNTEISQLKQSNHADHAHIRKELADTKQTLTDQHLVLRDKIEDIWKHVSKN